MKRNLSMDLLKVIAMLMVVLRHSLSQGGILEINEGNTIWFFGIGFRSLSVIAVNVFVLVTSYLMTEKKVSYFGLIKLMLQVIFYSWIIYIGLVVFKLNEFNLKDLITSMLPVLSNSYWFITAYVGLYLLIPFLNKLVSNLTKREHISLLIISTVLFSIIPTIIIYVDTFNINSGYSLLWFIYLFFVGSFIKKHYNPSGLKLRWLLIYLCMTLLMMISVVAIKHTSYLLLGVEKGYYLFLRYNSLLALISSISFFLLFLNINLKNNLFNKMLPFLATNSLAVYLIHHNQLLKEHIWSLFNFKSYQGNYITLIIMIFATLIIFIFGVLIESVRSYLFKPIYKLKVWTAIDKTINEVLVIDIKNKQ